MKNSKSAHKVTNATRSLGHCLLGPLSLTILSLLISTSVYSAGSIKHYEGNVFTNDGQGTVEDFIEKLRPMADTLKSIDGLDVYVGYHGDSQGDLCRWFNDDEKAATEMMAKQFPNARLHWLENEMTDDEIRQGVETQSVFFTWCDSDTRVNSVMGDEMPPSAPDS